MRPQRGGKASGARATAPFFLLLCAALLWAGAARADDTPVNLWPIYDDRVDPVDVAHARSGLGPIVGWERALDGTITDFAVRPLFHWRREDRPEARTFQLEALYPLFTYRRDERDWEWQFFELLNGRSEGSQERERRQDFFPFYFSGETPAGQRYRAVLPFYGDIYDRLGQDEIHVVLFPGYARFLKGGAETTYAPYPLVSWTHGERSGLHIVPFYGREEKPGVFERGFVLWPFYLWQRSGLDTDNPETSTAFLPFYYSLRSPERDSTTVLWPLFSKVTDRAGHYEQWFAPWPVVSFARGEGRYTNRVIPFYSYEKRVLKNEFLLRELTSTTTSFLFPVYIHEVNEIPGSRQERHRVLWWLYSDTHDTGRDGDIRRTDSWPFFHYARDREGAAEFQALALLEPFLPANEWIAWNYSPLWSLYSYRRNPAGAQEWSFLWNLLRHQETAGGRAIEVLGPLVRYRESEATAQLSLLGGLFHYELQNGTRTVRLFGWPAVTWGEPPQPVAALRGEGGPE
ncbi:MAG TPA: hypothetical protein VMG58_16395 [Candidatus Sulfotelmatobacter sp.]|nr:hypothetical protein [Candidatus Sulfotelmatobacter sp.]